MKTDSLQDKPIENSHSAEDMASISNGGILADNQRSTGLKANQRMNNEAVKIGPIFHPSPTMRVEVGHNKFIRLNRRERRRQHLYGNRVMKVNSSGRRYV